MTRRDQLTRRDRCNATAARLGRMPRHVASKFADLLAERLEVLSHQGIPKFDDLLEAIDASVLQARKEYDYSTPL